VHSKDAPVHSRTVATIDWRFCDYTDCGARRKWFNLPLLTYFIPKKNKGLMMRSSFTVESNGLNN